MDLKSQASKARNAARDLATMHTDLKNDALQKVADTLRTNKKDILKANKKDMMAGEKAGLGAMLDRLLLTEERVEAICKDIENVISLDDPVGQVIDERTRPNGLKVQRVRYPLGVVGIIYEARPNVTVDAATLCLKSGNAVMLKGGSDAINSNREFVRLIKRALEDSYVPSDAVQFLDTTDRSAVGEFLQLRGYLDVVIPRGGKGLINFVVNNSNIPVIETGASVVHIYIDDDFDLEKALNVVENAKTRRVSICNALDVLLVHENSAESLLPPLADRLKKHNVEIRACEKSHPLLEKKYEKLKKASPEDYDTEFLDYVMAIRVVPNFDEALDHIYKHSLKHSEAIVTENKENAERFLREVDSACCFLNASTQFSDGGQFGLGAEIGISTQKLHVRGPFALLGLTSFKWLVWGDGQTRPQ